MSKKRRNYMHKADALFSKIVRERDDYCQAAGTDGRDCNGVLQCAHIHSRSYKAIRCNFDNAVALCQGHHMFYTYHRIEWEEWVKFNYPGRWDSLKTLALAMERVDWKARHDELKLIADNLELL